MSESRPIQRYQKGTPAGAIITPQGPAVIQVIDIHSPSDSQLGYANPGTKPRKVGGINIVGAVLRRWWLVALVTMAVGGAGVFAAKSLVRPVFEASVMISYHDAAAQNGRGQIVDIVRRGLFVLNAKDIPLIAAHDPDLQKAFPGLLEGRDLEDPAVQADVIARLKDSVDSEEVLKTTEVVRIFAMHPVAANAQLIANAYAKAFVKWCQDTTSAQDKTTQRAVDDQLDADHAALEKLRMEEARLKTENNFDAKKQIYDSNLTEIARINAEAIKARIELATAEANKNAAVDVKGHRQRRPQQEKERVKLVDDEKGKDSILKAYVDLQVQSLADYNKLVGEGMTPQHPKVTLALEQMDRAKVNIEKREKEIADVIETKIRTNFELDDKVDVAKAEENMRKAEGILKALENQLKSLDEEAKRLNGVKLAIEDKEQKVALLLDRIKGNEALSHDILLDMQKKATNAVFKIEEEAALPLRPKEDKRMKVQAAGVVGGLFLGILLALLIDKFDKRLRDPRDVEVMLNVPLLGTIPKIQELKRIKGEQARNLIAEEFRIIRTQVLFGNPELQHKLIAITSPQPGDGKTSLAVNLAISIAKAGRRVLLIDGDLRKPDIHRVFNIPDSPGFSELIAGSHEAGAVIRKSDIDGLEILAAGTPIVRPSELLSRPEMVPLLASLGELYDHIVMDTAPLLPVSDTHILVGMMDACICSFNAEVDRDTVNLTHDILRRSHANVIGCVMNQVKYKQSGSYHRGKTAYDSYYNSTRGAPAAKPGRSDPGAITRS